MRHARFWILAVAALIAVAPAVHAQWGDVSGQIVFEGDIPELEPKVVKGDPTVKNPEVCAAETIPDYTFKVNPENKGIADVFVWVRRPTKVNPELANAELEPLVVDQKYCQFLPYTAVVRTGQKVVAKSQDATPHNDHGYNILNPGFNITVAANDREGIEIPVDKANKRPEPLPIAVKCDIHPHMEAYWLIVDHPYAAVTGEDGTFTIKGLPAGKNVLTVWHSRGGYLARALEVDVPAGGEAKLDPVTVKAQMSGNRLEKLIGQ